MLINFLYSFRILQLVSITSIIINTRINFLNGYLNKTRNKEIEKDCQSWLLNSNHY